MIALALVAVMLFSNAAYAVSSPSVFLNESLAYRNVIEDGDILIITRYELPWSISDGVSDGWCVYLSDQTGCDSTPAAPEAPTSLIGGRAFTALYTDYASTPFSGTVQFQANAPRIGHGLHSVYLGPGHGLTWEDPDTVVCVEANFSFFDTLAEQSCSAPSWSQAASDQESQRADLEGDLPVLVSNLESALLLPRNSLVTGDGITVDGRVYALEVLNIIDSIVPGAFVASTSPVIDEGYTPSDDESQLQQSLDSDGSGFLGSINWLGVNAFGMSGGLLATLGMFAAGAALGFLLQFISKNSDMFYLGMLTAPMVGLAFRAPTVAVAFVTIVVLGTLAGWWFLRKAPS